MRYLIPAILFLISHATHAGEDWKARVDDVVSARVVSITAEEGTLKRDAEGVVIRDGKEVARLRIRTPSGVCKVLSGEVRKGDLVVAAPDAGDSSDENPDETADAGQDQGDATGESPGLNELTNRPPAAVQTLLKAEGAYELAAHVADSDENLAAAEEAIERIYPAIEARLTGDLTARVAGLLHKWGKGDLGSLISEDHFAEGRYKLAPVYPAAHETGPAYEKGEYGQVALIDPHPELWAMPGMWGRPPAPADFSGWSMDAGMLTVMNPVGALIRTDFELTDAEMRGQVKAGTGQGVYLILSSDVIVRFYPQVGRHMPGNVGLRFGHNNLRTMTHWGNVDELKADEWVDFSLRLQNDRVQVTVAGSNVINVAVSEDENAVGGFRGHAGFGSFDRSSGGFRNIVVSALDVRGQRAVPRFRASSGYEKDGDAVDMLADGTRFRSLVHNHLESHKSQHRVESGMLSIRGAPYAQFTLDELAGEHYRVSGRMRWKEDGAVWFRAHSRLMLGLQIDEQNTSPYLIKYSTGNFHHVNRREKGPVFKKDEWYDWTFTYHAPLATLVVNDYTLRAAWTEELKSGGPVQFGLSTYNCDVDFEGMRFEALKERRYQLEPKEWQALLDEGQRHLDEARRLLAAEKEPGALVALDILEGKRPAVLATAEELQKVALDYRQKGDWTTYLAILEADVNRQEDGPEKEAARAVWLKAKEKYELAVSMTDIGEIGLDSMLKIAEDDIDGISPIAEGAIGRRVWLAVPGNEQLVQFDAASREELATMSPGFQPAHILDRGNYLLCIDAGASNRVVRIRVPDGTIHSQTALPAGEILGFTSGPDGTSYVSIDENGDGGRFEFGECRIHRIDEDSLKVTRTEAIGMSLAADPFGRYLFAGFVFAASPERVPDPGFLQVVPYGTNLDHLIRYRIKDDGLEYSGERPMPGIGGEDVVVSPDGREVAYLGRRGYIRQLMRTPVERGIPSYPSVEMRELQRVLAPGRSPLAMSWNPVSGEAYVLAADALHRVDGESGMTTGIIPVPASLPEQPIRQMEVTGDGKHLLIATAGERPGVFFAPIPEGGSGEDEIHARYFTAAGERQAEERMRSAGAMYLQIPEDLPELNRDPLEKRDAVPALDDVVVPAVGEPVSPSEAGGAGWRLRVQELESFVSRAADYPWSWLALCHEAESIYTNAPALRLEAGSQLLRMKEYDAARAAAHHVAQQGDARIRSRAYNLLSRIHEKEGNLGRAVTAGRRAIEADPANPLRYDRLGDLLALAYRPKAATHEYLTAWRIFPGLPDARTKLKAAGIEIPAAGETLSRTKLFETCSPSVVLIKHESGVGTGFLISRSGLLLTNHHVVMDAEGDITVTVSRGSDQPIKRVATVLASDALRDIALLQINPEGLGIEPLHINGADEVKTGDTITAIGNPGMGSQVLTQTATEGIVSNASRMLGTLRFIQVTAAVNPGNSGGPLLNPRGEVIGMVTLKAQLENVGFAVPSDELMDFLLESLK